MQVTVPKTSSLVGVTLQDAALRQRFDSVLLGVKRGKGRPDGQFRDLVIAGGDILVFDAGKASIIDGPDFTSVFTEVHEIKAGLAKEYIIEVQISVRRAGGQAERAGT